MKQITITILFSLYLGVVAGQMHCNYAHYEGSLENGTTYIADLTFSNGKVTGYYYYELHQQTGNADVVIYGDWNYLEGKVDGNNIILYEMNNGDTSAVIRGSISGNLEIKGDWESGMRGLSSEFNIKPVFPEGTVEFRSYCHLADTALTKKTDSPKAEINLSLLLPASSVKPGLASLMNKYILQEYAQKDEGRDGTGILKNIRFTFFKQYVEKNKDLYESGFSFNWVKYLNSVIYYNEDGYTVYRINNYGFTGGAHGITRINYIVFDTENGVKLNKEDIFIEGYEDQLSGLIDKKLRELFEIPADKSLQDGGFFESKVQANDNILMNMKGLGFLYNQYEIAPYSYGQIEVFFSFAELESIFIPGFRKLIY
ncbi:MAG: DUF3298 and DUF4163 domain-containing protein [Bacteroidetes bacterium]|nr:DUF3298 and DUF4163 domain-containing protein [Bacteroidota bacterium]